MDAVDLYPIIFPHSQKRVEFIRNNGIKFSHYTSAAVGLEIVKKGVVWLRNTSLMNDYSEIIHGEALFRNCIKDENRRANFIKILLEIHPDLPSRIFGYIDAGLQHRIENTYITCLSEHGNGSIDEAKYGRLSMWRAYGGTPNVALILNNNFLSLDTNALGLFSVPVLYADVEIYTTQFDNLINNIEENLYKLKNMDVEIIYRAISFSIHCSIISTKHIGFSEEREWRVIYSPGIYTSRGKAISGSIETINDIPQKIHKLDLSHIDVESIYPSIIDGVIIGPTKYAPPIRDVFVESLHKAGVSSAADKVKISGIPLRT